MPRTRRVSYILQLQRRGTVVSDSNRPLGIGDFLQRSGLLRRTSVNVYEGNFYGQDGEQGSRGRKEDEEEKRRKIVKPTMGW